MTQPTETEAYIRAADDEAGVTDTDDSYTAAKKYMNALARRIAAEREAVPVAAEMLAFLHGEGPLEGRHFGDRNERGQAFWWRSHLPHAPKEQTDAR